jgi:lysophospholipase
MTNLDRQIVRLRSVLPARDGTPLFIRRYDSALQPAQRVMVIVHGAGEHGERYDHVARLAVQKGWAVIAGDLRGHGQSGGTPTHLLNFDDYLDDLDCIIQEARRFHQPVVLMAHSMGGLTAIRYLQSRAHDISALVALCPLLALRVPVSRVKKALGRLCTWIAPQTRFQSPIRSWQVTRSREAQRKRDQDPLRSTSVTASWYFKVLDAICEAWTDAPKVTCPLLIVQGEQDAVVQPSGPVQWWPLAGSSDKKLVILKDHLHELLTEPDWVHTAELVFQWLDARVPIAETAVATFRRAA